MINGKNDVHIVYASDDRFAEILGVSLVSLFENNKSIASIQVYILDSNISMNSKNAIEDVFKQYHRKLPIWISARNIQKELQMEIHIDRGSLSQYARLFISSLLPDYLERVLYLDCDTIINQCIGELWEIDLQGNIIAALMDAFSKYYRMNIGLQPNDIMFNSGVILIDLKKWKEKNIEEKLLHFIVSRNGIIQQGDQGALNAILSKEVYCFEARFNSVTIFYDFSYKELMTYRKPPCFYSAGEVEIAKREPVIIHYTTSFLSRRPWVKNCKHMYVDEWIRYREKSPWREKPFWNSPYLSKKKAFCIWIALHLPRTLMIHISSFFQVMGRPLLTKYRIYKSISIVQKQKKRGKK
ncbi:MAG: glycosyltransferase family 8 protein [Lachnospiraceae bacterium]|nr:glycosyltransferase family 8 protein [Lachnospiraceae bacterium]